MKNNEQRLPFDEVKDFSKRLNNTIRDWAVKTLKKQPGILIVKSNAVRKTSLKRS